MATEQVGVQFSQYLILATIQALSKRQHAANLDEGERSARHPNLAKRGGVSIS